MSGDEKEAINQDGVDSQSELRRSLKSFKQRGRPRAQKQLASARQSKRVRDRLVQQNEESLQEHKDDADIGEAQQENQNSESLKSQPVPSEAKQSTETTNLADLSQKDMIVTFNDRWPKYNLELVRGIDDGLDVDKQYSELQNSPAINLLNYFNYDGIRELPAKIYLGGGENPCSITPYQLMRVALIAECFGPRMNRFDATIGFRILSAFVAPSNHSVKSSEALRMISEAFNEFKCIDLLEAIAGITTTSMPGQKTQGSMEIGSLSEEDAKIQEAVLKSISPCLSTFICILSCFVQNPRLLHEQFPKECVDYNELLEIYVTDCSRGLTINTPIILKCYFSSTLQRDRGLQDSFFSQLNRSFRTFGKKVESTPSPGVSKTDGEKRQTGSQKEILSSTDSESESINADQDQVNLNNESKKDSKNEVADKEKNKKLKITPSLYKSSSDKPSSKISDKEAIAVKQKAVVDTEKLKFIPSNVKLSKEHNIDDIYKQKQKQKQRAESSTSLSHLVNTEKLHAQKKAKLERKSSEIKGEDQHQPVAKTIDYRAISALGDYFDAQIYDPTSPGLDISQMESAVENAKLYRDKLKDDVVDFNTREDIREKSLSTNSNSSDTTSSSQEEEVASDASFSSTLNTDKCGEEDVKSDDNTELTQDTLKENTADDQSVQNEKVRHPPLIAMTNDELDAASKDELVLQVRALRERLEKGVIQEKSLSPHDKKKYRSKHDTKRKRGAGAIIDEEEDPLFAGLSTRHVKRKDKKGHDNALVFYGKHDMQDGDDLEDADAVLTETEGEDDFLSPGPSRYAGKRLSLNLRVHMVTFYRLLQRLVKYLKVAREHMLAREKFIDFANYAFHDCDIVMNVLKFSKDYNTTVMNYSVEMIRKERESQLEALVQGMKKKLLAEKPEKRKMPLDKKASKNAR